MKYVHIQSPETVVERVTATLSSHLRLGERVTTWLLSGGSAIDLQVRIAQALQTHDVSRLHIGLMDEHYGPTGHKDENYAQLIDAHFPLFITRVLTGDSSEKTTKTFGEETEKTLASADFSLGLFGIGSDGHTAGIKPHSPAVTSTEPAACYDWDEYNRITITPSTIRQLDEAIIYAIGSEKINTLRTLLYTDAQIEDQPAQILKDVRFSTLYTDNALS